MGLTSGWKLSRRHFVGGGGAWALLPVLPAAADPPDGEDARLMALLQDIAVRGDALEPLGLVNRGGVPDIAVFRRRFTSMEIDAQRALNRLAQQRLARIRRDRLSAERRISYNSMQADLQAQADRLHPDIVALQAVRPFNHFGGFHVEFPSTVAKGGELNYVGDDDYRRNLEFIAAFPIVIGNAIARFREGIASGVVETRITVINMIAQIDAVLASPVAESPITSAIRDFPTTITPARQDLFAAQYTEVTAQQVYPAYRRLRAFLADEYLPEARQAVGISAMKGGTTVYRLAIEEHTTLRLAPDAVHDLGRAEVTRIHTEMVRVKDAFGFAGSLQGFFDHIRIDPRFHPRSRQELANGYAAVARAVDAQVPQFFNHVPRTQLQIHPYPAYRERYEAGGSYSEGSPDGRRPGIFFYNAYDLPSRFLSGITTLYLHEGAPGHHFQISLAQEDDSLPDFQRFGGNNAYVEGWALYAETLGFEMGLYQDPLQLWGTLDDEMLRAMRLVVDTGIHAGGWSREAAIAYMLGNSGMGESDAAAEVDRYIAWPGQALGYKIGGMTIQRLKHKAQAALGARFDIRAFHDQILGSGALRLAILEAKIDRWIAQA